MATRTRTRTAAITAALVMLATAPAALAVAPSNNDGEAQPLPRVQHLRTVTTTPASGKFRCGRLRLTITHGTETEVFEGLETRGVTFIDVHRRWNHVRLTGSDGRVYRTGGSVTREKVVLVAPDDENPVWDTEIIVVRFHNRHVGSPGYLREVIKIRNGVRTDVVTGPCDFA
jgi:hypothetical protein